MHRGRTHYNNPACFFFWILPLISFFSSKSDHWSIKFPPQQMCPVFLSLGLIKQKIKTSDVLKLFIIKGLGFLFWWLWWKSYPSVPRPDIGGLGGFCVGGLVLDSVPPLIDWLFPCCCGWKETPEEACFMHTFLQSQWVNITNVITIYSYRLPRWHSVIFEGRCNPSPRVCSLHSDGILEQQQLSGKPVSIKQTTWH